ncbi:MAG: ATP-binding cassette domain-containing protein [Desulfovibrio sp.]|jgi:phospholipid/cholesterol/gamma-HCH transport system ATP-binding protein|nr:ATP-binding cassette domain-containing protein [Desulfovibrio sp.]
MEKAWDIEFQDVSMGYGENVVLDSISVTLPGGKISAVLGGSGGGKTTMLRHIIGLSRPMRGRVLLGGRDLFSLSLRELRTTRRHMGVLFQDGALLGQLTVAENTGLPLTEHTKLDPALIREIVLHKLSLVGLADFADYYPSELSGGMKKRAGLARALVTDPPLLLCDEPTSGLDPISAAQMDELLLDMKERFPDMTIVSVSHDLASVRAIADHVIVLHEKGIAYSGPLADLEKSQDPYLRRFLNRSPARTKPHADAGPAEDTELRRKIHAALGFRAD